MFSEFPLFLFTTLAGLAIGLECAHALYGQKSDREDPWKFSLACLVLLGLGLLGVLFHLGRPQYFYYAMANVRAGITQEAFASILFGVLILIQLAVYAAKKKAPQALNWITAIVGVVLACVMGFAYAVNVGTPAFTDWSTTLLFPVGDVAMGLAVYALARRDVADGHTSWNGVSLAMDVILAVLIVSQCAHFFAVGQSGVPFACALALLIVGAVMARVGTSDVSKKSLATWGLWIVVIAVVVSRVAFYSGALL